MSDIIEIKLEKSGTKALQNLLQILTMSEVQQALVPLFEKLGAVTAGHIIKTSLSGQLLKRRTGSLARSVTGGSVMRDGVPAIRVGVFRGPAMRYATTLEYGTKGKNPDSPIDTIRPKNAKALAWPQPPVLTPAGVAKIQSPRQYKAAFGYDLKFVPFRRGIAIGALYDERELEKAKEGDTFDLTQAKAAYILLKQLDLEPTHFMRKGMIASLPMIARELAKFIKEMAHGTRTI